MEDSREGHLADLAALCAAWPGRDWNYKGLPSRLSLLSLVGHSTKPLLHYLQFTHLEPHWLKEDSSPYLAQNLDRTFSVGAGPYFPWFDLQEGGPCTTNDTVAILLLFAFALPVYHMRCARCRARPRRPLLCRTAAFLTTRIYLVLAPVNLLTRGTPLPAPAALNHPTCTTLRSCATRTAASYCTLALQADCLRTPRFPAHTYLPPCVAAFFKLPYRSTTLPTLHAHRPSTHPSLHCLAHFTYLPTCCGGFAMVWMRVSVHVPLTRHDMKLPCLIVAPHPRSH